MGAKQTKIEGTYLDIAGEVNVHQTRTIELEAMHIEGQEFVQNETPPRAVDSLRRRFFKGFTYNLNDPRSPHINRTPLVFDDKNDKTLSLDDTFSDLFVASRTSAPEKVTYVESSNEHTVEMSGHNACLLPPDAFKDSEQSVSASDVENGNSSVEFASLVEDETMPCDAVLTHTPLILQQAIDPRSPAAGRTPIIFEDDDEAQVDVMLEDILGTLSLDLNGSSSSNSFNTATASPLSVEIKKPINKHLDRVRATKKPEKPIRKPRTIQKQRIYLDCENANITPKRKMNKGGDSEKRTPLSCVKNRVHLRSRSVESKSKSPKQRLSLTSYDDNLNPVQDSKVINLHSMQGDIFDF